MSRAAQRARIYARDPATYNLVPPPSEDDVAGDAEVGHTTAEIGTTCDEAGATPASTKITRVLALLTSAEGATLEALVAATGWLPHTTRAALTGLRKKGHVIERTRIDSISHYRIIPPVVAE